MSNAKEELNQVYYKMSKANETLQEYQKYKERAEKMTAVISETTSRSNKPSDKVGDNAVIMADLSMQYLQRYNDAERERDSIIEELNKVIEPYRTILFRRYVLRQDLRKIAEELFYSYDSIAKKHRIALKLYERRNKNV